MRQLRDFQVVVDQPLAPDVGDRAEEALEWFGSVEEERFRAFLFAAVLDGEQERDDIHRVIRVEMGEEDAVYTEGVEPGAQHPTHGPVPEVQNDRLSAFLYDDATLAARKVRHDRAAADYRDLHSRSSFPNDHSTAATSDSAPPTTSDAQSGPR